jgi:hypothetical protein
MQTPVDLQSYAAWKQESGERAVAAGGSRMSLSRRPVLDLPLPLPAAAPNAAAPGAEFEPVSPLDVPAFLRRHPRARSRLHPEAARRHAARGAGVPQHVLRRDVQPGFQTVYRLFNDTRTWCASACSCRRSRNCRRCCSRAPAAVTLESQTPIARVRRARVLGVVRVGLHEPAHDAAAGGLPLRAADRTEAHPLVVIGGAVTFVNPEPLALFADVIAAGEGRGARARSRGRRGADAAGPHASAARAPSAASTSRRSTTSSTARTARSPLRAARGHRRAANGAQGRRQDHRRLRPAGDHASSRPTRSSARASSWRWCAAAPTCAASAGRATTTCPCARFRPTASSSSWRGAAARLGAPGWCRLRSATTPRSSTSCAA